MTKILVTAAALAACAGLALVSPVLAADQETDAVWGDLRPNLTPPFSGDDSKTQQPQDPKDKNASETDSKDNKK
jgi:hypothetical protein